MKKKIIWFLIFVIFFTGCSATYDLDISGSFLTEKVKVSYGINEFLGAEIKSNSEIEPVSVFLDPFSTELYNTSYEYTNKGLDIYYNYTYDNFSRFTGLYLAATCYDIFSSVKAEDKFLITTSEQFLCFDSQYYYSERMTIRFNLSEDVEAIEHNADEVNGKTYIWKINRDNFLNKPIKFSYKIIVVPEKPNFSFYINMIIFTGIIMVSIVGIITFFYLKNKKANQM